MGKMIENCCLEMDFTTCWLIGRVVIQGLRLGFNPQTQPGQIFIWNNQLGHPQFSLLKNVFPSLFATNIILVYFIVSHVLLLNNIM